MAISQKNIKNINPCINNLRIERVEKYNYQTTYVNEKNTNHSRRKLRTKNTSSKMVYSFYLFVWCEAMYKYCCKKIEAFGQRTYRIVLKISWMDNITIVEVLRKVERELLLTIKSRKTQNLDILCLDISINFYET